MLDLHIDSLAYGGRGVARHGDLVVFVARGLPGDHVRARVTKFKKTYAEARVEETLEVGPGRVEARCSHFGTCGGCAWQNLHYAEQLHHKQAQVADALRRLGGFHDAELREIVPAVEQYGYRNKLEFSWLQTLEGPDLGFHVAGRWDQLMAVETCHIASARSNELRTAVAGWARGQGLEAYDQRSGKGYLRHLVVREGRRTGDLLAVLVTAPGEVPGVEQLARAVPEGTTGVLHAVNDGVAEVTAGLPVRRLFGRDTFTEQIRGLELELTSGAFLQTNTEMCDVLYGHALEAAALQPDDTVWDLYCGAGAIGLLAAQEAGALVGVEISDESVQSARRNAERNGVANATFVTGDVARELPRLMAEQPAPSVVFVDPPRAGLTARAVRRLIELDPERIAYVSCNPTTLAPNARQLAEAGYVMGPVQPVDMFPHTHHIECVTSFTKPALC